jgi:hypothetical protein
MRKSLVTVLWLMAGCGGQCELVFQPSDSWLLTPDFFRTNDH